MSEDDASQTEDAPENAPDETSEKLDQSFRVDASALSGDDAGFASAMGFGDASGDAPPPAAKAMTR